MIPRRAWRGLVLVLATPVVAASIAHCERFIDAVDLARTADAGGDGGLTSDFIWYVLDETQGTTAKDSSSHGYDIALTGVTWAQGANFDGVSGGGSTSVDPSYRTPPITISAWLTPKARADQTSNQHGLVPYPTNAIGDDVQGLYGYELASTCGRTATVAVPSGRRTWTRA